jgi:hypothetical protein
MAASGLSSALRSWACACAGPEVDPPTPNQTGRYFAGLQLDLVGELAACTLPILGVVTAFRLRRRGRTGCGADHCWILRTPEVLACLGRVRGKGAAEGGGPVMGLEVRRRRLPLVSEQQLLATNRHRVREVDQRLTRLGLSPG